MTQRFWLSQGAIWGGYALALLLPWIGVYTIASMLPNKIAIAVTGVVSSTCIAALHTGLRSRGTSEEIGYVVMACAAIALGFAWNGALVSLIGERHVPDAMAVLEGGVPRFGGALYHALVLLTWTVGFVAHDQLRQRHALVRATRSETARIVLRDGRRSFVVGAHEIDRVQADGDYVRVFLGPRQLLVRDTLTRLHGLLPASRYARIHRSSIVNVERVREVVGQPNRELVVIMNDGTRLRASRTYVEALRRALPV